MNDASSPSPTDGLGRFGGRVLLFLAPLALGALLVIQAPLSRAFAWHFVKGDCWGHGIWIHARIQDRDAPIEVAFVGTSRTILAIDDAGIEATLAAEGHPMRVANLGYCRNGRNLHVAIARELLETQPVRDLVVEVSNEEFPSSHPVFGYVAQTDDLLGRPWIRGPEYVSDAYHGLLARWDEHAQGWLAAPAPAAGPPDSLFGFAGKPDRAGGVTIASLLRTKARRAARASERGRPAARRLRLAENELRTLGAMAAATGTRLHFLYLQSFGEPWDRMWSRELYASLGDVWVPPASIFDDPENWWDPNHLNVRGASALSAWIAAQLAATR